MSIEQLKKISLWLIYGGVAIILALPLYLDSSAFFPFVASRVFIFRSVVEIMFVSYLFLAIFEERVRPRLNFLNITLTLFLVSSFISSILGPDFYRSFWGDMERSEGLLLWLHLWVLFFITSSTLQSEQKWMKVFDFSLVVATLIGLFGLAQYMGLESVLQNSGTRVDGTFGNAAFFAGYMLFHIGLAVYLFFRKNSHLAKGTYLLLASVFGFLIFASQTRGAVIGLVIALLFGLILTLWSNRSNSKVRYASLSIIILLLVGSGVLYLSREQSWVTNSAILERVATISVESRTAQTRLATWGAGLEGFKERPIFGYGLENFNFVFDKNFPPLIFEDEGSVVWFDRAHNVVVDRLVMTGAIGLVLYLLFIFYPVYYLIRNYLKDEEKRGTAIVFSSLIVAFFVQNLFIFETLATYTMLFLIWAFFSAVLLNQGKPVFAKVPQKAWIGAFVVVLILTVPLLWKTNVVEAKINREASIALRIDRSEENFFQIVDQFKKIVESGSYGTEEYRLQFIEFVGISLTEVGEVAESVRPVITYTDEQVEKQTSEFPYNTKNLILAMRHFNFTRNSLAGKEIERLERGYAFLPRLITSSPTRAHVYQEAGYSQYYLYREFIELEELEKAQMAEAEATRYFQEAIDLNPDVLDLYVNPIIFYLESDNDEGVEQILEQKNERDLEFSVSQLNRLQQSAKKHRKIEWVKFFSEKLIEASPDNVSLLIDLALSFAYEGNRVEAIALAERIKSFGGQYVEQAEIFIGEVNSGVYEADAEALGR